MYLTNHFDPVFRWEPFKYTDEAVYHADRQKPDYDENNVGGLQLFYNLDLVSKALTGRPCQAPECIPDQPGLDPKEINVGCHRTAANPVKRDFATGRFDELAFWAWRLNETEKPYFLGGHSK